MKFMLLMSGTKGSWEKTGIGTWPKEAIRAHIAFMIELNKGVNVDAFADTEPDKGQRVIADLHGARVQGQRPLEAQDEGEHRTGEIRACILERGGPGHPDSSSVLRDPEDGVIGIGEPESLTRTHDRQVRRAERIGIVGTMTEVKAGIHPGWSGCRRNRDVGANGAARLESRNRARRRDRETGGAKTHR